MIPALMITKTIGEIKEMVVDLGEKYYDDIKNIFLLEAENEIY